MTNPPEHAHSRSAGRSSPKRSEAADLGSNPETGWKLGAFGSAGEALLSEGEDQRGGEWRHTHNKEANMGDGMEEGDRVARVVTRKDPRRTSTLRHTGTPLRLNLDTRHILRKSRRKLSGTRGHLAHLRSTAQASVMGSAHRGHARAVDRSTRRVSLYPHMSLGPWSCSVCLVSKTGVYRTFRIRFRHEYRHLKHERDHTRCPSVRWLRAGVWLPGSPDRAVK